MVTVIWDEVDPEEQPRWKVRLDLSGRVLGIITNSIFQGAAAW